LRQETPERQGKNVQSKRRKMARRYSYSVRPDSKPIALRAFWDMHIEALNWSGMGHAEYAAALGLSPLALRIWRDRLEESGEEMDWRSLLHPNARAQLSSAANCAAQIPLDRACGERAVKPAPLQRREKSGRRVRPAKSEQFRAPFSDASENSPTRPAWCAAFSLRPFATLGKCVVLANVLNLWRRECPLVAH
jgi:hypothetical protein